MSEVDSQELLEDFELSDDLPKVQLPSEFAVDTAEYTVFSLRTNTASKVNFEPYNESTYEKEPHELITDQRGKEFEKFTSQDQYIRFRPTEIKLDEDAFLTAFRSNKASDCGSNAKLIEWSDGTMSLAVGNNMIEITKSDALNTKVAFKNGSFYKTKADLAAKLMLTTNSQKRDEVLKIHTNINKTLTQTTYTFFDPNEYNKEDFARGRKGKMLGKKRDNKK